VDMSVGEREREMREEGDGGKTHINAHIVHARAHISAVICMLAVHTGCFQPVRSHCFAYPLLGVSCVAKSEFGVHCTGQYNMGFPAVPQPCIHSWVPQ